MSTEDRTEPIEPTDDASRTARWRRSLVAAELRVIDAVSSPLLRLRNRLEAPSDGEDASDDNRRSARPHPDESAQPQLATPPKPRRLIYFLLFVLFLTAGAISGAAFSYRLLSKALNSNSVLIDRLRDELALMRKQESRNLKELAGNQRTIRAYDRDAAEYLKEIEEYKARTEELRRQLTAARSARGDSTSQESRGSPAAAVIVKRATPQKTGTCTMDSTNVAANLGECVEKFNRQ